VAETTLRIRSNGVMTDQETKVFDSEDNASKDMDDDDDDDEGRADEAVDDDDDTAKSTEDEDSEDDDEEEEVTSHEFIIRPLK